MFSEVALGKRICTFSQIQTDLSAGSVHVTELAELCASYALGRDERDLRSGETLEEFVENIKDAYKLMLESEPVDFFPAFRNRIVVELGS